MRIIQTVFFAAIAAALFCIAPASAKASAASLTKEAKSLTGKTLSPKELRGLLIGNALCYVREARAGPADRCYYYLAKGKLRSTDTYQGEMERAWRIKPDGTYCHENVRGNEFCYNNVQVKVQGEKVQVTMARMSGRKEGLPIVYTLMGPGKPGDPKTTVQTARSPGALSGAEFKKLVIGNTLQLNFTSRRSGRERDYRFYFIDEKTLYFTSARSSYPANEPWSVTKEGTFCRVAARNNLRRCYRNFQVKGDKLITKITSGNIYTWTLLKGKHRYY